MSSTEPFALGIQDDALIVQDNALVQYGHRIIDDFEHNNLLAHYTVPSSTGTKHITTSAARSGTYGYEGIGEGSIWSHPGRSNPLPNYPAPGEVFEIYFRPRNFGSQQYWFFFGGTADSESNRYQIEAIMNGTFRVRKDVNGSRSVLTTTSQSFSNQWYRIEVNWFSGGGFRIRLYPNNSTNLLAQLESNDSQFSARSKVGVRCSGSGRVWVDDWSIIPEPVAP